MVIHSYPSRSYRDPWSLKNVWIRIVVVICARAKVLEKQYTKRLLPDFLIPGSRMRLDKVVEAGLRKEGGSSLEECCRILGCIDLRTARMHLKRTEEAAKETALFLAEEQAAVVHLHENDYLLSPLAPLKRLFELCIRQKETQVRGGNDSRGHGGPWTLLQAVLWKTLRKKPTSYASRPPPES